MSKYDCFGAYLSEKQDDIVRIRFAEIERILGFSLPRSAYAQRTWWSNNPNNSVMTRVWRKAGFRSEQVDMIKMKLVFRRVPSTETAGEGVTAKSARTPPPSVSPASPGMTGVARPYSAEPDIDPALSNKPRRHPIFGALKGHLRVVAGTDLTGPADPEWGEIAWGENKK